MLSIQNYKKVYGTTTVLQVENLQLQPGLHWLAGENGSGKTTLLTSVAGLIPFKGSISVNGTSLRKSRMAYTKMVSYAAAEPQYPDFLTGGELLQFYIDAKGGSRTAIIQMAEALGIDRHLAKPVGNYSSGMLKKLSLTLAFVSHPTLVLLDEPFITLDVEAVDTLHGLIAAQHRDGVSIVFSSHQPLNFPISYQTWQVANQTIQLERHANAAE